MSTRQLRKLQRQRELEIAALGDKEQAKVEDESDDPPSPPISKGSLFANLIDLEDIEEDENLSQVHEVEIEPIDTNPRHTSGTEKSKKSKSKLKLKSKNGKYKNKLTEDPEVKIKEGLGGDDIEKALRELGIENQDTKKSQGSVTENVDDPIEKICALLCIHGKNLKVANEMRKLFGKTAVEDKHGPRDMAEQETIRRQQNLDEPIELETVLKANNPPGKGISEVILRRNFFIQGRSDWPKGTLGGLSMEEVKSEKPDGIVEFRYVHNQSYQKVQNHFYMGVEMGDPQFLVNLLVKNPDHISLLLQVSRIAKSLGNNSLSSDLLERALFFLGKAATSHFTSKLSQGKARLNFARFENRELWLAGYHYIKSLMMKGTYRTALEWAKLLLSLDPENDPYGMRLLIHNLSLRGHECKWLFDFYDTGLHIQRSINGDSRSQSFYSHTSPSLALAAIYTKNRAKAREILRESMIRLPWLYYSLFRDLNLDIPPCLMSYYEPESEADVLFTKIYISQTKDLWVTPETTSLLMEIGNTITKIEYIIHNDYSKLVTLNVVRFVYLDGSPEMLGLIPMELRNYNINSDSDPIPPIQNIVSYVMRQRSMNRDILHGRSDYLVVDRLNNNRESNTDEGFHERYLYEETDTGAVYPERTPRAVSIETAIRLYRYILRNRSPENVNENGNQNENENEYNVDDNYTDDNHTTIIDDEEEDDCDDDNREDGILNDTTNNQNSSSLNSDRL
ncbi:Ribosome quality control complex subunit 1 [Erysiphe neolycopersici]|uniref:Ribosome quality control complex subunit 1 n=1 Tax=Erysiphe neolycopersici TaxID=212602 RepID=A0A420HR33_9PEZI|nr:Ribosome quality control complex subunit 1 [Erysiphe neolycopersici]